MTPAFLSAASLRFDCDQLAKEISRKSKIHSPADENTEGAAKNASPSKRGRSSGKRQKCETKSGTGG
jgi:hypothetical protein